MKDMSLHILDVVRNSYEAKSSVIRLSVVESISKNIYSFSIRDNGKGMDNDTLSKVLDPFYTTRTTRKVGLGLSLLKANAILCGGNLEIRSSLGVGTYLNVTFIHNHIDRPPNGDLPFTLLTLILTDPNVNLIFKYTYEENHFSFELMEIREILGVDIPFDNPDVISWFLEYVRENIKECVNHP
jgi:hypothetical protein